MCPPWVYLYPSPVTPLLSQLQFAPRHTAWWSDWNRTCSSSAYRCWNEDTLKRPLCPSLHLSDPKPVGLRHFNFPGISWGEGKGWRLCQSEELVSQKEISQFQQCARSLHWRAWSQDWLMCRGQAGSHLEQNCLSMRTFTLDHRLKQTPYEEESNGIRGCNNDHTVTWRAGCGDFCPVRYPTARKP